MDISRNIPICLSSGVKHIGAGLDTSLHVKMVQVHSTVTSANIWPKG